VAPRFPTPEHLLPRSKFGHHSVITATSSDVNVMEKIFGFCSDLKTVQGIMRAERMRRNLWKDTIFPGLHISPILGDLLAIRSEINESNESENATVTLEAFRLAAILYVSNLRAKFGIDTLSGGPRYATKLRIILPSSSLAQGAPPLLLIWILSVAITSQCLPEQRLWFTEVFNDVLVAQNITSFPILLGMITNITWDEDLLMTETQSLKLQFEA
jgi:hypothetical protein